MFLFFLNIIIIPALCTLSISICFDRRQAWSTSCTHNVMEKVVTCGLLVLLSDCPAIPSLDTDLPTSGAPGGEEKSRDDLSPLTPTHISCVSSSHALKTASPPLTLSYKPPGSQNSNTKHEETHSLQVSKRTTFLWYTTLIYNPRSLNSSFRFQCDSTPHGLVHLYARVWRLAHLLVFMLTYAQFLGRKM